MVDIYTAWILEKIADISNHTPRLEWPRIKVLSRGRTAAGHYSAVKLNPEYFGNFIRSLYKSDNMITQEEIAEKPSKYFIKSSFVQYIKTQLELDSITLIYSMWKGYLDEGKTKTSGYLSKIKNDPAINMIYAHSSGHATLEHLGKMVGAIKPKKLIPIHTEHGEKYDDYFLNVLHLKDGQLLNIEDKITQAEAFAKYTDSIRQIRRETTIKHKNAKSVLSAMYDQNFKPKYWQGIWN